jgi:transcriptional regulator GlxA family with amidase domain
MPGGTRARGSTKGASRYADRGRAGDGGFGAVRNGGRAEGGRQPLANPRSIGGRRRAIQRSHRIAARSAVSLWNGVPVIPDVAVRDNPRADILVLPELWLGPDEHLGGQYQRLLEWIRARYRAGSCVYSACSGALMLAETGLLDGRDATSHWGYQDLFRRRYPQIRFRPEPSLCFSDPAGRIVTAGGTTSWHDLALHIISRHASPGEALRIAKVYLLKWHDEGQLPYAPLVRPQPHSDAVVRTCEAWLTKHYREPGAVARVVGHARIPDRTLKRRFKSATGLTLIDYLQNLRIEEAKRLLENTSRAADDISAEVGYEDSSFFRRLFKRRTGLAPREYRRMFNSALQLPRDQHASSNTV